MLPQQRLNFLGAGVVALGVPPALGPERGRAGDAGGGRGREELLLVDHVYDQFGEPRGGLHPGARFLAPGVLKFTFFTLGSLPVWFDALLALGRIDKSTAVCEEYFLLEVVCVNE